MADVAVELDERAGVEELLEPLAGEQPALLAAALDRLVAALVKRLLAKLLHPRELLLGRLEAVGHARSLTAARW